MSNPSAEKIRLTVRNSYAAVAAGDEASCCAPGCCAPVASRPAAATLGYSADDEAAAPEGANLGLGCGNPQAIAALREGETVVDLGCGAGFDCFLAARAVGPTGRVIGVDMTHEMLERARKNAEKVQLPQVEFRLGQIEHLPIGDNTVDVILSNCVVNLSPDKPAVFLDAFRVLKPGGRLAIADVVAKEALSEAESADLALLVGCIAGAATVDDLQRWLGQVGFVDVRIAEKPGSAELVESWAPGNPAGRKVMSATIEARKP